MAFLFGCLFLWVEKCFLLWLYWPSSLAQRLLYWKFLGLVSRSYFGGLEHRSHAWFSLIGFLWKKKKLFCLSVVFPWPCLFFFFFFNKVYFYLMCLNIFPACMSVYQLHGTMETRGCWLSGTGVIDSYELRWVLRRTPVLWKSSQCS